ncbi:hypothetical protein Vafri_19302 [Volvox africanus]|uniref:Methyltransferase domain-containing protein n=1 Tax=Volvox africanus TaxID=51714 RepID=A0A8J4F998_9CHLO|nr:hypothetical protein Vafri_19302 [Volvox africanus]
MVHLFLLAKWVRVSYQLTLLRHPRGGEPGPRRHHKHQSNTRFYGYNALRKIVRTFVKRNKPVLQVGCGNSNFQEGMARDGYQVVNTDISEVVIDQMRIKHQDLPNLRYVVSDCRNMPEFLDCQFGSVIDKDGTMPYIPAPQARWMRCCAARTRRTTFVTCFGKFPGSWFPGGCFCSLHWGAPRSV